MMIDRKDSPEALYQVLDFGRWLAEHRLELEFMYGDYDGGLMRVRIKGGEWKTSESSVGLRGASSDWTTHAYTCALDLSDKLAGRLLVVRAMADDRREIPVPASWPRRGFCAVSSKP